jgi:hypothetical protein
MFKFVVMVAILVLIYGNTSEYSNYTEHLLNINQFDQSSIGLL